MSGTEVNDTDGSTSDTSQCVSYSLENQKTETSEEEESSEDENEVEDCQYDEKNPKTHPDHSSIFLFGKWREVTLEGELTDSNRVVRISEKVGVSGQFFADTEGRITKVWREDIGRYYSILRPTWLLNAPTWSLNDAYYIVFSED